MESFINEIKNEVAKDFGATLEIPTLWNYAMMLTHRTKKQLELYEEVIRRIVVKLPNSDREFKK